jgi:hypothetical protein
MEMANCRKCKKLFAKIDSPICDDCKKEEEKLFEEVKKYLRDNPNSTLSQIAEATGMPLKKLMAYLREGRLEVASGELFCRQCGAEITTGNFCNRCAAKMGQRLAGAAAASAAAAAAPPPEDPDKPLSGMVKMHTQQPKRH